MNCKGRVFALLKSKAVLFFLEVIMHKLFVSNCAYRRIKFSVNLLTVCINYCCTSMLRFCFDLISYYQRTDYFVRVLVSDRKFHCLLI